MLGNPASTATRPQEPTRTVIYEQPPDPQAPVRVDPAVDDPVSPREEKSRVLQLLAENAAKELRSRSFDPMRRAKYEQVVTPLLLATAAVDEWSRGLILPEDITISFPVGESDDYFDYSWYELIFYTTKVWMLNSSDGQRFGPLKYERAMSELSKKINEKNVTDLIESLGSGVMRYALDYRLPLPNFSNLR